MVVGRGCDVHDALLLCWWVDVRQGSAHCVWGSRCPHLVTQEELYRLDAAFQELDTEHVGSITTEQFMRFPQVPRR